MDRNDEAILTPEQIARATEIGTAGGINWRGRWWKGMETIRHLWPPERVLADQFSKVVVE
jgi:hypothetical protein